MNVSAASEGVLPDRDLDSNSADDSYSEIIKSTSIIGGSQAINYVIGMVRTKLIALLLGPSGVGLIGLFQSSIAIVTQLTGLGIASSGVRQIAEAHGSENAEDIGRTIRVLRRACWVTGILGWVVTAILSRPLSIWAFETPENATLIALLGASLFFTAISGGQKAAIQGTRRIGDLARMIVISSLASSAVAIAIYWVFGEHGIVPVLIITALINLAVSWWFVRRVEIPPATELTWGETFRESKQLTGLGIAFMWGGLLAALVDMGVRSLIIRDIGVDGTGIYQAVWALSGMFANFILGAMGADFYPRLTAVADRHKLMNSMVNEQIEIGVLIALPGLLGTLAFAPMLLMIFYSSEFMVGAILLPWFVAGIFFRVVSWPVGFTILAKGATKWFLLTQTSFYAVQIVAVWYLIKPLGLVGVGIGFFLAFLPIFVLNLLIAYRLSGFAWSVSVMRVVIPSACVVAVGFACATLLPTAWNMTIGGFLTVGAGLTSIRGITKRLGPEHRIARTLNRIPGMRFLLSNLI